MARGTTIPKDEATDCNKKQKSRYYVEELKSLEKYEKLKSLEKYEKLKKYQKQKKLKKYQKLNKLKKYPHRSIQGFLPNLKNFQTKNH